MVNEKGSVNLNNDEIDIIDLLNCYTAIRFLSSL